MNDFLDNYIDDAEYIIAYNNVIKILNMLNMDYDIDRINDMSYEEIKEANKKLNVIQNMVGGL